MRANIILRYMGFVLLLNAAFMFASAGISYYFDIDTGFYPLLLSGMLTSALALIPILFVPGGDKINNKEGYCIVVGSWLMSCVAGMMPYLLWGGEFTLVNAWFESVSGYTTTGATILTDVESVPKGLLFWRSATHWMGGVGVVLFALVVLPTIGRTKMTISNVEISNIAKDNYRYRSNQILHILLWVYLAMTVVCILLLKTAGMNWFDAVNHALSTISTGGFSNRNASVGFYDNVWIEIIIMFFMILASLHFGVIFATVAGKHNNIMRSEVVRFFLLSMAVTAIVITISLLRENVYDNFWQSLRVSAFQTVSLATTTGFSIAGMNTWGGLPVLLLLYMSIQCGCAGSTCGGIKADRVVLAAKILKGKIRQQQHPNAIITIKLNNTVQDQSILNYALLFIVAYVGLLIIGTAVFAAFGFSLDGSFAAAVASLGNVGQEACSFGGFPGAPVFLRFFAPILMLLGRLEIFGFLQLFLLNRWK